MTNLHELTKGNRLATKDREIMCPECGRRCTIGTDAETEYGHNYNCPRRPEQFPTLEETSKHWNNCYHSDDQENHK